MSMQAVIFDMDGVIIDSEALWRQAQIDALAQWGATASDAECETLTKGKRLDDIAGTWCRYFQLDLAPQRLEDAILQRITRLIAAKGSPIQPTIDSLKGKHVGVLQGSTQEGFANANWREKGVDVVAYQNQDLIYSDLAAGRLDAAFQDEVAASEGFLKQPAGKEYAFAGPSVKDKKYFGDGTGIGLRKDDTELKAAFDKAFNELRKDGTYDKLAKKYFDFNVYGD